MCKENLALLDITEDQLAEGTSHGCFLYKKLQESHKRRLEMDRLREDSRGMDMHELSIRDPKAYEAMGRPEIKDELFTQERRSDKMKVCLFAIYAHVERGRLHFRSVCEPNIRKDGSVTCSQTCWDDELLADVEVATDYESPAARFFSLRTVNVDPGSEISLRRAKVWLEECYRDHESCPKRGYNFVPTRLLRIIVTSGSKSVRLVETTSQEKQPYAALSYCWGGDQRVKTTRQNLEQMKSGIDLNSLPATLRDAVRVTVRLEMRFLWIDALCIVQDDERDKALEIAAMPNIFSNAAVTIAASRAASVEVGFLAKRPRFGRVDVDTFIDMRFRFSDGKVEILPLMNPWGSTLVEPLETRGWAFQERMLSPRMLDFGTLTTEWVCQSAGHQQRLDGWRERRDPWSKYPSIQAESLSSGDMLTDWKLQSILHQWYQLLELYTGRDLTFKADRLPAMSGIAERYATILGDEYLAGLWRSSLARDILWGGGGNRRLSRSSDCNAPSWSWAVTSSKVSVPLEGTVDARFQVISCEVTLAFAEAKFGSVRGGRLHLRGRVRREGISFRHYWGDSVGLNDLVMEDLSGDEHTISINATIDDSNEAWRFTKADKTRENHEAASMEAPVLLLVNTRPSQRGLVLHERGNGEYVRLGVFGIPSPPHRGDWSDERYSEKQFAGRPWAFLDSEIEDIVVV